MDHRRHSLLLVAIVVVMLVVPLVVEAKRPESVGRPTVTIVPPIPLLPGLPAPASTPAPRATPAARPGPAEDPLYAWLGPITVLSNRTGFHLWFKPEQSQDGFVAGRQYHAVFKLRARCATGWTEVTVPDREPYSLTGFAGNQMCYRVSGPDAENREAMVR
ncbi:MAG: hypothetical protein R6X16_16025 [Anaerolineae bacterium]